MAFSPAEKAARSAYKQQLLENEPYLSAKSLSTYIGPLGSNGTLTAAVKQVPGLLPEDTESLLQLTDPETLRRVALWWQEEGLFLHRNRQSAMNRWLALRLDTPQEKPAVKRTSAKAISMAVPPHGIRLLSLLQAFYPERVEDAPLALYEELLRILTLSPNLICSGEEFKEHTAAFRTLRGSVLRKIHDKPDQVSAALRTQWSGALFARKCRTMAVSLLSEWAPSLFSDLSNRAYENSLFSLLSRLYSASETDCPTHFLALVERLLLDCDPSQWSGAGTQDGIENLTHPEFWDSELLWHGLEYQSPSPALLDAYLALPTPVLPRHSARLAADLLQGLIPLCDKPHHLSGDDRWQDARNRADKALELLDLHWPALQNGLLSLPRVPWHRVFSEGQLWDGPAKCVLRAWLLRKLARLALEQPSVPEQSSKWGYRLMLAQETLRRAEQILLTRTDDHQSAAILSPGEESLFRLLTDNYLMQAEVYCQLSQQEREETCLADAVALYMTPARIALDNAKDTLEVVLSTEREAARTAWSKQLSRCRELFFTIDSPLLKRLGLRTPGDDARYKQEHTLWRSWFPHVPIPPQAPHVFKPLDPQELRSAEHFETVYSGTFDSATDNTPQQKTLVELTIFQLLASGKNSLLQMNQIVDNRVMLQMLPVPGFRHACREGHISLSCFSQINSPRDYLLDCLHKDTFRFSSSAMYDEGTDYGPVLRQLMIQYLDPFSSVTLLDFPEAWREEAEFLTESYQLLFECFQPSDLLRYHQNAQYRFPPRAEGAAAPAVLPLPVVLEQRLSQLTREAQLMGRTKQLEILTALDTYRIKWSAFSNRSLYDTAINTAMKTAGPEEIIFLTKFRKLVYDSYFLSNGARSSKTILLTQDDPDLVLSGDLSASERQERDTLSMLFRQRYAPASVSNLCWNDICAIATTLHEIDIRDKTLTAKLRAKTKSRFTGYDYITDGQSTYVSGLTPVTSDKQIISIASAEDGQSEQALEYHNLK